MSQDQTFLKNLTVDLKELAANHCKYLQMSKSVFDSRLQNESKERIAALVDVQREELNASVRNLMRVEAYTHLLDGISVSEYQENQQMFDQKIHDLRDALVREYDSYLAELEAL